MAKPPIEIGVASETKAFEDGIRAGVIKPLENTEDALRDLAKEGDRAGDKLEDAFEQAQAETKKTAREIDDTAAALERAAREARKFETGVRAGTDGAIDATAEFKDEAKQNLAETVASFRGDAEDIAQIAQDTLAGVVSNLGPMGIAAGVAGAAGIGLIIAAIGDAQKAEEAYRAEVSELATELIERGDEGAEAVQAIADRMKKLATETDPAAMSLDKLRSMATALEVPFADLSKAYAEGRGDLGAYIKRLDERIAAEQDAYDASTQYLAEAKSGTTLLGAELEGHRSKLKKVADTYRDAEADAAAWAESGGEAMQARADVMDKLQGELDEAIGAWSDYVDAETGATDPAAYLAAMQARMTATSNFNSNVQQLAQQFGLSADEVQMILDQGVDFAPMLQSIIDSGMGEQYVQQVRAMLSGGQAIVDGTPTTAKVTVESDTGAAEKNLAALAISREAPVKAEADTTAAARALDGLAAAPRTAVITARLDFGGAEPALAKFLQRRQLDVTVNTIDREGRPVP